MKILSGCLKLALLIVIFSGCTSYGYYFSKPVEDKNSYEFYPNGIVLFNLNNVELFLQPKNNSVFDRGQQLPVIPVVVGRDSPEEFHYSNEYFDIEIVLYSQKEGFLFNPKEVYLTLESGQILRPGKYLIRERTGDKPLTQEGPQNLLYYNPDDPYWENEKVETENTYIPMAQNGNERSIGFILRFETGTPRPGAPFSIQIKGLKHFDQKISVPEIQYKDKARYNWTFDY